MGTRLLEVIEVRRPEDRLRCYISGSEDGSRRVKARVLRGRRVVQENVFFLDEGLSPEKLVATVEKAMREVAARTGGTLRALHNRGRLTPLSPPRRGNGTAGTGR